MKNITFWFLIFIFFFKNGYSQTQKDTLRGYKLVWEDNFDRKDIFSTGVWSKIPRGKHDWNNTMSDEESLFQIKNGILILSGKPNTNLKKDTAPYITGGVFTKNKMYFENGRIEIRCKLDAVEGSWPAVWLLPKEGTWPSGGEIDILERLNLDTFVYQTVHSTYTKKEIEGHQNFVTAPIFPKEYNVYAVEIDKNELRFYVNNQLTFTYPKIEGEENQFPFNREYYLLIDMQLGGSWVGAVKKFKKPVKMYIDWVRYYQK
ncbi:MAG: glycoside hydrolase family 16 protein [Capnocytophaga sp.]|nr:glycoside hydrolase family 16 protein [Capnocytophaga sp.]